MSPDDRLTGVVGLWGRTRVVLVLLGCVAAAACSSADTSDDRTAEPALPTIVNAPGTWSDDVGIRGPVAALGVALRTHARGVFDETESLELFTVSAIDGGARWLQLADPLTGESGLPSAFTLSPDGRWIAWTTTGGITRRGSGWIAGWSVMDTATGRVRELRDPSSPTVRSISQELVFSGDSRYLLTDYEPLRSVGSRRTLGSQLVAWDVESGTSTVLEEPGHRPQATPGRAPSGVVWSRGSEVVRLDPATGARTSVTLPGPVGVASWGPDDESFAYVEAGSSQTVHVGRTIEEAVDREVRLPRGAPTPRKLSWQDPTHLVVDRWRTWLDHVDLETGDVTRVDMGGDGEQVNTPFLADGLWQRPLRDPVAQASTTDPRAWWRWGSLGVMVIGVAYARRRIARASGAPA